VKSSVQTSFAKLPRSHFACILADPPWRFKVWSRKGLGRSAERYYPTLSLDRIREFPVADVAADDAFLFLWCTGPFIAIGSHVDVMQRWGFIPSGIMFSWAKLNRSGNGFFMGTGYNSRHNVELCFVGRRGNPQRLSKSIRELIVAPVMEHSRKPVEAIERIEQFCCGPRLELFARRLSGTLKEKEWTLFGNQLAKL